MLLQHLKQHFFDINIEELKKIMGIEGKYKSMSHFKQRVINVALNEINEKTTLQATYKNLKHSRKIYGLRFYVSKRRILNIEAENGTKTENTPSASGQKVKNVNYSCPAEILEKHETEYEYYPYIKKLNVWLSCGYTKKAWKDDRENRQKWEYKYFNIQST